MDEDQAEAVAKALTGEAWNSGGDFWIVRIQRGDGRLIVISGDAIAEYKDETEFEESKAISTIILH